MEVQTESKPVFEYKFNPTKIKAMPDKCQLCDKELHITDEFIRLLDCNHIYHRICLIHHIADLTKKRFFLTRREQKSI